MSRRCQPVEVPITDDLTAVLQEVLPCGGDDRPTSVRGWLAGCDKWRRIVADYPNGWTLTVFFTRSGNISSARASMRMVTKVAA